MRIVVRKLSNWRERKSSTDKEYRLRVVRHGSCHIINHTSILNQRLLKAQMRNWVNRQHSVWGFPNSWCIVSHISGEWSRAIVTSFFLSPDFGELPPNRIEFRSITDQFFTWEFLVCRNVLRNRLNTELLCHRSDRKKRQQKTTERPTATIRISHFKWKTDWHTMHKCTLLNGITNIIIMLLFIW